MRDDWRVAPEAGIYGSVLIGIRVGGQEKTSVKNVLHETLLGPLRNGGQVEVGSPPGGDAGVHSGVVGVGAHHGKVWVSSNHRLHHRTNGGRATESVGGIDDTEHALRAMVGNGAVEEYGVRIVDDLLEDEVFQLKTRGEGRIGGRVARSELRALGDGVVVSAPDELDCITDGSIDGEGDVTKDTLGGSNINNMSLAGLGRGTIVGRHRGRVLGPALLDTVVIWVAIASPVVAPRTVSRGRIRFVCGRRSAVWRRGVVGVSVRRGIGIVVATVVHVVTTVILVVAAVVHVVTVFVHVIATIVHVVTTGSGEGSRGTPSV